jgi:hypothetical protein
MIQMKNKEIKYIWAKGSLAICSLNIYEPIFAKITHTPCYSMPSLTSSNKNINNVSISSRKWKNATPPKFYSKDKHYYSKRVT